jgi:predicted membrane chloride channel (bestrophin family)
MAKVLYEKKMNGTAAITSLKSAKKATSKAAKCTSKAAAKATAKTGATIAQAAQVMLPSYNEYTWKELTSIEKRRRAILLNAEQPFWKMLSHWDGTVLEILLQDSLLYITLFIYIAIRVWARYGIPSYVADLGGGNTVVIGSFISFFLVFLVNQTNSRYFNLYGNSMACKGRIFDTASLVVVCLPKAVATRLIRYMNAAHVAGYTGLSKTYPANSFFAHLNKSLGLLTEEELARMKEIDLDVGGSCQRELIAWCIQEIQTCHHYKTIDNDLAAQLRGTVLQLQAAFGQLTNAADLPIPFFYMHFVCLLSALYLPLFAISTGVSAGTGTDTYWTADVVAGLVVLFQAIFVIGLRIISQKMGDPYGDDLVDLSVIFYCTFTWRMSNRILNAKFPPEEASEAVEEQLIQNREESIGKAFESDRDADDTERSRYSFEEGRDGVDEDGLPINQLEVNQMPSSRFNVPRRMRTRTRSEG